MFWRCWSGFQTRRSSWHILEVGGFQLSCALSEGASHVDAWASGLWTFGGCTLGIAWPCHGCQGWRIVRKGAGLQDRIATKTFSQPTPKRPVKRSQVCSWASWPAGVPCPPCANWWVYFVFAASKADVPEILLDSLDVSLPQALDTFGIPRANS